LSDMPVRRIWSLSNSGIGTTIAGSGNSGAYQVPGPPPWTPDNMSAIDLRYVDDVWLAVTVTAVSGGTLTVGLNVFDDLGNKFNVFTFSGAGILNAAGSAQVSLGKHGATTGGYIVFPEWGQVAWTCSGGSVSGTEIALYGS